jgi:hypothetical protein
MSFRARATVRAPKRAGGEHVDNRRVVGSVTICLKIVGSHLSWKGQWLLTIPMESLILAQDKRWRRA